MVVMNEQVTVDPQCSDRPAPRLRNDPSMMGDTMG